MDKSYSGRYLAYRHKSLCLILALIFIAISAGCTSCAGTSAGGRSSFGNRSEEAGRVNETSSETGTAGSGAESEDAGVAGNTANKAAPVLKCDYLNDPELIIPIAGQSAEFWKRAADNKYGGYFTYVYRSGKVDMSRPYKVTLLQSRDAYAFARAYQLTGNDEYLEYARKALDFIYQHAWDRKNGGWYQEMNIDGSLASAPIEGMDWNRYKYFFNQMYALCGITAMADATRSELDINWMVKSYEALGKLWDPRPEYGGYFDMSAEDWSNPYDKSPGTNVDGITTHAEAMYLLNLNPLYRDRFLTLADNLVKISGSMEGRQFGFVDNYDDDWAPVNVRGQTSSGNFLKPAWCLARAYLAEPREEYRESASKYIDMLLDSKGYDYENGGGYTQLDPNTGNPTSTDKSWWEVEQAVTAGLSNYYVSGDERYLKMADQSMDFFMKYMYDSKYGDVYNSTAADGSDPDTTKGNYWKGAYHAMELFYYTYLYGNLMLHDKPVSLYYSIKPAEKARNLRLDPVMLGKNKLIITGVTLDGKAFERYDGENSMLQVPANVGGEFKVTFKAAEG